MLSSWGVEFEGRNVEAEPSAAAELKQFGIRLVPVVVRGEDVFHGWNPAGLAAFLGVRYEDTPPLSVEELIALQERILEATRRVLSPLAADSLRLKSPLRDRNIRDMGYHVFRLSLGFKDAFEQGRFPEAWLEELPPDEMGDAASIVGYGEEVQRALCDWRAREGVPTGSVPTYYGEQTAHQLLERTVWHAAHHLRQIYDLLRKAGVESNDPLTEADFAGLPLPKDIW